MRLSSKYNVDPLGVARSLEKWGHAPQETYQKLRNPEDPAADDDFSIAVGKFQKYWQHLLPTDHPADGELDNATIELINRRFCDCPDQGAGTYEVPGFPKTAGAGKGRHWLQNNEGRYYLTWSDFGVITTNGVSFKVAMEFTRDETMRVCGMELAIRPEPKSSNLGAYAWSGDGRGSTLAYHYFPGYGSDPHNGQDVITGHWDRNDTHDQVMTSDITCHEVGHGLGLEHTSTPGQLMLPFIDANIHGWQNEDAARLQRLYGPPGSNPPPVDPEPEPPADDVTVLSPGLYRVQ